jgi:hypothetical protein
MSTNYQLFNLDISCAVHIMVIPSGLDFGSLFLITEGVVLEVGAPCSFQNSE